ncbi:MAG: methyl-accepting chemotaxis protein [Defluviitaleaceae bacterium]|nr:methyl-accepting chemotaxis protein [Defluviitaleaceae bacterium]
MLNSLKGKLIIPLIGVLVLLIAVMFVYVSSLVSNMAEDLTLKRVQGAAQAAEARVRDMEAQSRVVANAVAGSYVVSHTIRAWNDAVDENGEPIEALREAARTEMLVYLGNRLGETGASSFIVRDAEGRTILRSHSALYNDIDGSTAASEALRGRQTTSYSSTGTMPLGLNTTVPVWYEGDIIGTLTPLYFLHTENFMRYFADIFNAEVSIFNSTESLVSTRGQSGVGVELKANIADIVMSHANNGRLYMTTERLYGTLYYTAYIPVIGLANNNAPVGAISVAFSNESTQYMMFRIHRAIVVIGVIGFIMAVGVLYLFIARALKPLGTLKKQVREIADGNININIDRANLPKDEIGDLSMDIIGLTEVIRNVTDDVDRLITELNVNGEIDYRIDGSNYSGAYRQMIDGMNTLMDKYVSEILSILGLIGDIGAGNFNVEVPVMPGKKVLLKQKFDSFIDNIKGINNDIATLAQTAAAGNLDAKADAGKYAGDWAVLLERLNALVGSIADKAFWYESLLDSIPFPISVTDNNMCWTFINKPTEDFLGKKRKDVLGQHCSNWGAKICKTQECGIACYKRGKAQTNFEQGAMHCQVDVAALKDPQGKAVGYIEVVQDITQIKASAKRLSDLMSDIQTVSEQVSIGSRQISNSSQDLAKGAQTQAAQIQNLNASIDSINAKTKAAAQNAANATALSKNAKQNAVIGNGEMQMMLSAMEGIKSASDGISKIIKTIEEIAFQTNLLALNASVEAARAGEHGRGFMVVAEEVRNLAARSQASATETNELISESGARVAHGTEIAVKTARTLETIVADFDKVSNIIAEIAGASSEQADAIMQISSGLADISSITQHNSAVSEEAAAASVELSAQADTLTRMFG